MSARAPGRRAVLATAAMVGPLLGLIVWAAHGPATPPPAAAAGAGDEPREVALHAHAWGFSPRVLRVMPGETVRFTVASDDILHGFAVNELDVNLPLRPGQTARSQAVTVRLPEGTYTIHCSVFCGLGHPAMKARLLVGTPGPTPESRLPWVASLVTLALVSAFVAAARPGAGGGPRP